MLIQGLSLILLQLLSQTPGPVLTLSPPHAAIGSTFGGYSIKLLHEMGSISLPTSAPPLMPAGNRWFVEIQNLGPEAVTIEGGHGFSVHLLPKEKVRIESDTQRYFVQR